jgi:hypothetical protein
LSPVAAAVVEDKARAARVLPGATALVLAEATLVILYMNFDTRTVSVVVDLRA